MTNEEKRERIEKCRDAVWLSEKVLDEYRRGVSYKEITRRYGVSRASMYAFARRAGILKKPDREFTFIYALLCPKTDEIRYIGKSDDPKKRLLGHMKNPMNGAVGEWFAELRLDGLLPKIKILARVKYKHWSRAEIALIWKHAKTCDLLNLQGTHQVKHACYGNLRYHPSDRVET